MKTENKIRLALLLSGATFIGIGIFLSGYFVLIGAILFALLYFFADDDYDNYEGI